MSATKKTEPPKTRQQKADKPAPSRKATRAKQPAEPIKETHVPTPSETTGMGASDASDVTVYCAFRRNLVTVPLNEATGRQTRQDNGGYRFGVVIGDRQALFYNKKAANQLDAIWFARLKAVECAKEWFPNLKHLTVMDEYGEVKVTNRASLAIRYAWVANNHAQNAGFSISFQTISAKENKAKAVAAIENGTQFYTAEARKNYLGGRSASEPSQAPTPEDEEGHEETPQVRSAKV